MTPLSNIITGRSKTFSLNETLERMEREAHETITFAERNTRTETVETTTIELSQIKQALLDMRMQIDIIVAALDENVRTQIAKETEVYPAQTEQCTKPIYTIPYEQEIIFKQTQPETRPLAKPIFQQGSQIIEGIFTGNTMSGADGKLYTVPENYASKSKMVEGDLLKLTITQDGRLFYKQIGPVKRTTVVGELIQDPQGNWVVLANMTPYRILTASVTFHRARQGDQVVILVPENGNASWGAVDVFLN